MFFAGFAGKFTPLLLLDYDGTLAPFRVDRFLARPWAGMRELLTRIQLLPVVRKYQIGVIPYYSLAAEFLTGKYRSQQDTEKAARGTTVQKYLNERGFGVVAALDEVAHAHGSTPACVALAWLLAQPGITAPIASATNEGQLVL
jgi:aryl-alcohol dehydrogenase-like predicted oxidoreductase